MEPSMSASVGLAVFASSAAGHHHGGGSAAGENGKANRGGHRGLHNQYLPLRDLRPHQVGNSRGSAIAQSGAGLPLKKQKGFFGAGQVVISGTFSTTALGLAFLPAQPPSQALGCLRRALRLPGPCVSADNMS